MRGKKIQEITATNQTVVLRGKHLTDASQTIALRFERKIVHRQKKDNNAKKPYSKSLLRSKKTEKII